MVVKEVELALDLVCRTHILTALGIAKGLFLSGTSANEQPMHSEDLSPYQNRRCVNTTITSSASIPPQLDQSREIYNEGDIDGEASAFS